MRFSYERRIEEPLGAVPYYPIGAVQLSSARWNSLPHATGTKSTTDRPPPPLVQVVTSIHLVVLLQYYCGDSSFLWTDS